MKMNEISSNFRLELSRLSNSLHPQFEAMRKFHSKLENSFPPIPSFHVQSGLEKTIKSAEILGKSINDRLKPVIEIQNMYKNLIEAGFAELRKAIDALPPRVQEGIRKLSEQSWFFDQNMDLDILLNINDGKFQLLERELIRHYESHLSSIEEFLITHYPNRKRFFKAIFKAHRAKDYELSIPVIFTQVDGICKEITDEYIFMSKDKKPGTSGYIESMTLNSLAEAMLSPFSEKSMVLHSERERGQSSFLNRHVVLHGDSVDYPNKLNSLKAISMLNYIGQMLVDLKDKKL